MRKDGTTITAITMTASASASRGQKCLTQNQQATQHSKIGFWPLVDSWCRRIREEGANLIFWDLKTLKSTFATFLLYRILNFQKILITHGWLRAFWKKKFQNFKIGEKKNFPQKMPQGPSQAQPLCLGVFPSCFNTSHQKWWKSQFLSFFTIP